MWNPLVPYGEGASKGTMFSFYATKASRGHRHIAPVILNLSTSFRYVATSIPKPLYPWGKKKTMVPIQLEASLDILQKKHISCTYQGSNPNHPACSLVTTPTTVSQLGGEYRFQEKISEQQNCSCLHWQINWWFGWMQVILNYIFCANQTLPMKILNP